MGLLKLLRVKYGSLLCFYLVFYVSFYENMVRIVTKSITCDIEYPIFTSPYKAIRYIFLVQFPCSGVAVPWKISECSLINILLLSPEEFYTVDPIPETPPEPVHSEIVSVVPLQTSQTHHSMNKTPFLYLHVPSINLKSSPFIPCQLNPRDGLECRSRGKSRQKKRV